MTSNAKKGNVGRKTQPSDNGTEKEDVKGYHNDRLKSGSKSSILSALFPVTYKKESLKDSPVDLTYCDKSDSMFYSATYIKNCLRCQLPFTGSDDDSEFYRGYHKKCMKCATCGISLDGTNIYLTTERTTDLHCNECKGRRLSTESFSKILTTPVSKTVLNGTKSDECVWYDCSSGSSNIVPNLIDPDQERNFGDQNGLPLPVSKETQSLKNRSESINMGYRDLHGRGSKENLSGHMSASADNFSKSSESSKLLTNSTMKIRSSNIPQRLIGATNNLKKTLAMGNLRATPLKAPATNTTKANSNISGDKGESVLISRTSTSTYTCHEMPTSSSNTSPSASGAIPKVRPRYNLRKPSVQTKPTSVSTPTPVPNPEESTSSALESPEQLWQELAGSDAQQHQCLLENIVKPKSFKNAVKKAFTFTKGSRLGPVKAFPPESRADETDDTNKTSENDSDSASAFVPNAENPNSLAKSSKEKLLFLDCSICFDSLLDNGDNKLNTPPSTVVATKCGHIFHEKCIKEWLKAQSNKKCPICCSKCSSTNLLTVFVDAGPHRQSSQSSTITNQEITEIHETLQKDYEELKLKYDALEAQHELCQWKSVVIQSLQSAFDLESHIRQQLEQENEHLLKKIENMQLEAFVHQSKIF